MESQKTPNKSYIKKVLKIFEDLVYRLKTVGGNLWINRKIFSLNWITIAFGGNRTLGLSPEKREANQYTKYGEVQEAKKSYVKDFQESPGVNRKEKIDLDRP